MTDKFSQHSQMNSTKLANATDNVVLRSYNNKLGKNLALFRKKNKTMSEFYVTESDMEEEWSLKNKWNTMSELPLATTVKKQEKKISPTILTNFNLNFSHSLSIDSSLKVNLETDDNQNNSNANNNEKKKLNKKRQKRIRCESGYYSTSNELYDSQLPSNRVSQELSHPLLSSNKNSLSDNLLPTKSIFSQFSMSTTSINSASTISSCFSEKSCNATSLVTSNTDCQLSNEKEVSSNSLNKFTKINEISVQNQASSNNKNGNIKSNKNNAYIEIPKNNDINSFSNKNSNNINKTKTNIFECKNFLAKNNKTCPETNCEEIRSHFAKFKAYSTLKQFESPFATLNSTYRRKKTTSLSETCRPRATTTASMYSNNKSIGSLEQIFQHTNQLQKSNSLRTNCWENNWHSNSVLTIQDKYDTNEFHVQG